MRRSAGDSGVDFGRRQRYRLSSPGDSLRAGARLLVSVIVTDDQLASIVTLKGGRVNRGHSPLFASGRYLRYSLTQANPAMSQGMV